MRALIKAVVPAAGRRWLRNLETERIHSVFGSPETGGFALFGSTEIQGHIARIYLGHRERLPVRRRIHGHDWSSKARRLAADLGLTVISGVAIPEDLRHDVVRVPRFVAMSLDVGESEEALYDSLSESARSDVRKVRREGFQMEVCTDLAWLPEFYSRFHANAIRSRHGEEGFVMPLEAMRYLMRERGNELLCVTLGGERVGALLAEPDPGGYRMGRLGWRDADPALVKRGVLGAIYWFSTVRARSLGLRRLRMGGTPPYLLDGVFRFKAKWGARLDAADTRYGEFALLLDERVPAARHLVERTGMITYGPANEFIMPRVLSTDAAGGAERDGSAVPSSKRPTQ